MPNIIPAGYNPILSNQTNSDQTGNWDGSYDPYGSKAKSNNLSQAVTPTIGSSLNTGTAAQPLGNTAWNWGSFAESPKSYATQEAIKGIGNAMFGKAKGTPSDGSSTAMDSTGMTNPGESGINASDIADPASNIIPAVTPDVAPGLGASPAVGEAGAALNTGAVASSTAGAEGIGAGVGEAVDDASSLAGLLLV